MKYRVFISYSNDDRSKVDLIVSELSGSKLFEPIVIAFDREVLKPLADKVSEGIKNSEVIIPILTEKSINTQWINQEIGYATALDKKVVPIVEKNVIDRLKGFVHKQIDLPYSYTSYQSKATENKEFKKELKQLLNDLESEYSIKTAEQSQKGPSVLGESLAKAKEAQVKMECDQKKKTFLNSYEGIEAAKEEFSKIFKIIESTIAKIPAQQKKSVRSQQGNSDTLVVSIDGFSVDISWHQQYANLNDGAFLLLRQWKGYPPNKEIYQRVDPEVMSESKYLFDMDENENYCWSNEREKKQYSSTEIAENNIAWLLEVYTK